ncbi:fungal-specific transcription factor domain-domain-containing protein [Clohesyomyces aquaticus]|uniref:Fungal-specific transcription factor domain-domain-containing protein n=1 Tax=Clohesyomyces aquaticus TaxID=1231657 RepID=A0A1Y1ZLE2_9PLEO|nr:fungal-specific transcription factor domain-domain-containing protein [Clohesyomyces aquaticus]
MDERDDMDLAPDGTTRVQRACDSCRARKIRCDRVSPCSNCRASKLNCQTTAPTQKVQRQRVHISDEYERKIDRIEDRLSGIENVLESLAAKLGNLDIRGRSPSVSSTLPSRPSRAGGKSPNCIPEVDVSSPAPFEGNTALNSQSEFARDYLERAVVNIPSIGSNPQVQAALTTLQTMVRRQNLPVEVKPELPLFVHKAPSDVDMSLLERPPWEAVNNLLEKATIHPTMCFAVVFPFFKLSKFKEIMKETWDEPESHPIGRRLLCYGLLYHLFTEFASYPMVGFRDETYQRYGAQCRVHMETAMSKLDLFLPASYENILALLLAASYAVEMCKPSVCWSLNSAAANLCQHLGYHRIETMKDDTLDERAAKIQLFWFIYVLDKTLSLRLGRASSIQDWDMSLPFPGTTESPNSLYTELAGVDIQVYWIKVAQIQGQSYERLFSPAAFLKTEDERAKTAAELVHALNKAWLDRGEASVLDFTSLPRESVTDLPKKPQKPNQTEYPSSRTRAPGNVPTQSQISMGRDPNAVSYFLGTGLGNIGDIFYHADVVMHYSVMSLIQRAVSPDNVTFNQDCLESARAALVSHQRCSTRFNIKGNEYMWAGYLHWSVLQAPFTPFIVIFCNVITNCDPNDLSSLSDFVHSLESCRTISEGADKLYKMCHVFLQVAKLYVQEKQKETAAQQASPGQTGFFGSPGAAGGAQGGLDLSAMTQFDPYLSALGLVPNAAWPMTVFAGLEGSAEGVTAAAGDALAGVPAFENVGVGAAGQNAVQDWFSGSRYIMGLMEEDINMPDLNF